METKPVLLFCLKHRFDMGACVLSFHTSTTNSPQNSQIKRIKNKQNLLWAARVRSGHVACHLRAHFFYVCLVISDINLVREKMYLFFALLLNWAKQCADCWLFVLQFVQCRAINNLDLGARRSRQFNTLGRVQYRVYIETHRLKSNAVLELIR